MYAIVDCNSFYCSCERVFQPRLAARPVVVLSNNDGCIIARTKEAEALGLHDIGPYFKARDIIEKHDVAVFSSNYNLYGDMSRRVMETLRKLAGEQNVEVYSVDEAFVDLKYISGKDLHSFAINIKSTIEQWTGVKVSVGVAASKTLSKLANRLVKKENIADGVCVLNDNEMLCAALKRTKVGNLWGIGRRYADKLNSLGIETAWDLSNISEEWARKYLGGVVGVRLIKELNSEEAIAMDEPLKNKKMIATTRMFGNAVTDLCDIREAIATYTSRAAEKLRRQRCAATMINVFVVTNEKTDAALFRHGPTYSAHALLPSPTSITNELIKPAMELTGQLYQQGKKYKKAGVILSSLVPDDSIQGNFFAESKNKCRFLMEQIDNINFSMRNDVVKFASSGTKRDWKMRRDFQSPRYTTRWDELYEVK
jgi:DNA polymerase V